jgi:hypothetical protein
LKQGLDKAESKTSLSLYRDLVHKNEDLTYLADQGLPNFNFSPISTCVPISTDLFQLCYPSYRKVWTVAGKLASNSAHLALPSFPSRRL